MTYHEKSKKHYMKQLIERLVNELVLYKKYRAETTENMNQVFNSCYDVIELNDTEKQEVIEMYEEKEKSMFIKNEELKKQVQEKDEHIGYLENENYNLRDTVRSFKKKFEKIIKLFKEKLFGWGKKNPIYKEVLEDFKEKEILSDIDIKKYMKRITRDNKILRD